MPGQSSRSPPLAHDPNPNFPAVSQMQVSVPTQQAGTIRVNTHASYLGYYPGEICEGAFPLCTTGMSNSFRTWR